jgi:acyl-CoA synthetase (AMP-forming)/AMP-acid ligase II
LWQKTLQQNSRRTVFIDAGENKAFTAAELNDEVLRLADLHAGFSPGTRVAFCLPNGVPWMALFLALQKLGATAVPLDAGLPEEACLEMARYLKCHALFYRDKIHIIDDTVARTKTIACVKVTSGSTAGLPKQVPCRAGHLIADGKNLIRTMGLRPNDRNLATIPLGHSYGLGNLVMPLILQGTALVCASSFVPRQVIDWIRLHRATVFPSVPAIFRVLASMPGDATLAPLRLAISAGAPLTTDIARAFFERYRMKIHNFYGSSETGGICYDKTGEATLTGRSVGKPVAGVSVTIKRNLIRVKSAATTKRNSVWRMPDRGEWNGRGELVLLGRRGREVNIGGKKVHPSEVEQALRSIKGVSGAIVWQAGNADRAFLQAAVETQLALKEIREALLSRLPEWKFPKDYVIVREFPCSERGKIDFAALRKQLQAS